MIQVQEITFGYRTKNILEQVSFDVAENNCIAVLGNNGAGKSTLIQCMNRIYHAKTGAVLVSGNNLFEMHRREVAQNMAYVAQKNEVNHITVYDAVLLGRKPYIKWDASGEDHRIVEEILEKMNLTKFSMRYVDELSGGELQKIMLARALAQQPKLLLLDEPTSNLDPRNQYEMMALVRSIAKEKNIAVIVVIHDLNLALRYCDKFLFLKDASVYRYGGMEVMTPEIIESVYHIAVHIQDYHGLKIAIPLLEEEKASIPHNETT